MNETREETDGDTGAGLSARELVDGIDSENTLSRASAARRLTLIDRLRLTVETETGASWTDPDDLAWRDLRAEVAAVLTIHERSAQTQLDLARRLVHDFPRTLAVRCRLRKERANPGAGVSRALARSAGNF